MAAVDSVWGIDIGQCALKAMKLVRKKDGQIEVESFEVVEHANVLSQPDADIPLIIAMSLDEFLRRVDTSDSKVAVSVLGQSSFTRFVKLPPVEKSKIPDIVRFEAEQQIPFPIEEVTWRYQTFQDEDSPEVEAGIFAMKQVDVAEMLTYYANAGLDVDIVQMAPLALYNFMEHDGLAEAEGATLLADIGADKTHLVVADGNRIWTRTIQIGGNKFTEALVKSFKLSFAKAEKLKRTAASSKYARQIFQVMRPVFAALVQEIQRSIGYYTQLNRDSRFKNMVGMGNGFRLPGMQKYLEQNLNMPVVRVDRFQGLASSPENLHDHVLSLGVVYGLCLQGLDQATVHTNLLPEMIMKKRLWSKKRPMFVAAAACVLLAAGIFVFRSYADRSVLQSPEQQVALDNAQDIVKKLENWKQKALRIKTSVRSEEAQILANLSLRAYSRTWPAINVRIAQALLQTMTTEQERQILAAFPTTIDPKQRQTQVQQVRSDQAIMELIAMLPAEPVEEGQEPPLRNKLIETLGKKPRHLRDIVLFESMESQYVDNLTPKTETAEDDAVSGRRDSRKRRKVTKRAEKLRGFEITLTARTPLGRNRAPQRIGELKAALQEVIDADKDLRVVGTVRDEYVEKEAKSTVKQRSVAKAGEDESTIPAGLADPLFASESIANDIVFRLVVRVAVTGNGLTLPESLTKGASEISGKRRR